MKIGNVLCIILIGVLVLVFTGFMVWGGQTKYVPLLKATLPFGVLQIEGNFMIGTGSISGEEHYYFKYWASDGSLRSLSTSAEDCPIMVDGTFQLETNNFNTYYVAHIPRMPEENQTWTNEWIR